MASQSKAKPEEQETFARKTSKAIVMILGPLLLVGFSFAPFMQIFSNNPATATRSQQLSAEQLQAQVKGYEEVLKREPDNVTALRSLTELHLKSQNVKAAIPLLDQLVKLEPQDTSIGLLLSKLKIQNGDPKGGIAQLQALYQKNPSDNNLLQELVTAEVDTGNAPQAVALVQKRLRTTPEDRSLMMLLAMTYVRSKQVPEAVKIYDKLIVKDKTDFEPLVAKAIALSATAKDDATRAQAKSLFDEALTLAPPQQRPQIQEIAQLYTQFANTNVTPAPAATP